MEGKATTTKGHHEHHHCADLNTMSVPKAQAPSLNLHSNDIDLDSHHTPAYALSTGHHQQMLTRCRASALPILSHNGMCSTSWTNPGVAATLLP